MDLPDLLAWPRRADIPGMLFRRLIARHATRGLHGLTRPEQVLWLVFELCTEVTSDDLFFPAFANEHAGLVPEALRELGRADVAELLERGLSRFPKRGGERHEVIAALDDAVLAELKQVGAQLAALHDGLIAGLVTWIDQNRGDFTLVNAGLAAFRPVSSAPSQPLDELFALPPDVALPSLYVRAARKASLSPAERALSLATHAFGEISDEGGYSYLFCAKASCAAEAQKALEAAGAAGAAAIVGRAMAALPSPYPVDDAARRAALDALSDDAQTRLRSLQWELDELRQPTISALFSWAQRNRASFS